MYEDSRQWKQLFLDIYQSFETNLEATMQFQDEEDLHQARVDLRKLVTMLEVLILEDTAEQDPIKQCYRALKKLLKQLGKLRDWDVFHLEVSAIGEKWKGKNKQELKRGLLTVIDYHRQMIRVDLLMKMPNLHNQEFNRVWRQAITMKFLSTKLADVNINNSYTALVDDFLTQYDTFKKTALKKGIDQPESIEALHEVRLTSKKLRYTGKYLDFALHEATNRDVKGYKKTQEYLGNVNDYSNYLERLKSLQKKFPYLKCTSTKRVETNIEKKLSKAFDGLNKEMKRHKNKNGKASN
ncbi:MAG: CHAD domain-containing protein [Flammeovirgaceae bacterium]